MRLLERGHTSAVRARASGVTPICSGTVPRALALGQAAPAFAILAQTAVVSFIILLFEIYWHRRRYAYQYRFISAIKKLKKNKFIYYHKK